MEPRRILPKRLRGDYDARRADVEGWGDKVENTLTGLGITSDRWIALKGAIGLPPTCGCASRKKWLNKLGEQFGEAAQAAVEAILPAKKQ